MDSIFVHKLKNYVNLSKEDSDYVTDMITPIRSVDKGECLVAEGSVPQCGYLIISGILCCENHMYSGRRQISSYMLPGDTCGTCDIGHFAFDHSIVALVRSLYVEITREMMSGLVQRPKVSQALLWAQYVDRSILRERVVSLGARDCEARLAHLLCEFYVRMAAVGLVNEKSFDFPITQKSIAETLGVTTVHLNRSLQILRQRKIVSLGRRRITVESFDALAALADFRSDYLHLPRSIDDVLRSADTESLFYDTD